MPSLLNRRTVTKVDGQPHGYLFVLLCLVCFSAPSLFGAQTLVKQELFEQIGVLDRDAPGNLGTVWGSFVKRPVGPRAASGAPGWSSEIRGETTLHDMSLQTGAGLAARYSGMFGAWYFMGHVMTDGVNKVQLISLQNTAGGGGNPVATAVVDSEMKISLSFYNSPEQSNVVRLSPNTWYWIGVKWRAYANQGIRYDVTWVSKTLGGSLTVLGTPVKNALMGGDFQRIRAGAVNTGGYAAMIARYGAPSLFHLDNFADGNYPPGLLEPVVERHHWYVDTANGADSNTGLQPDEAWQSAAKINDEAQNLGILSTVDGFDHGDILVIDTRTKPLELGPDSLAIPTDGITIQPPAGQRYVNIKAEKTISPGAWQKTAGYDAIFQTPDTETAIVLWENDKWMHHPTGNKFEEVAAKLQATAGSFWTDGATLYVHTFDHSNPRTNQKIYSRSRFRGSGDSAILMSGNSWSVHGLRVRKTCLARASDNDPFVGYCFQQSGGSVSGTCRVSNSSFDFGSKHLMGFTADSTNSTLIAENVTCQQASPYVGYGGQSAFVSYMAAGKGNVHIYKNCRTIHNAGRIGSALGEARSDYPVFITHGPPGAYKSLQISNCRWKCGPFDDQGTVKDGGLEIENSRLSEVTLWSPNVAVRNCRISKWCEITRGGILRDTYMSSSFDYQSHGAAGIAGHVLVEGCILDLRANPTSPGSRFSPWSRSGSLSLTFRDNTFLVPAGSDLTLFNNLQESDALSFSSNAYRLGNGNWLIRGYKGAGQTFKQWQGLGFDLDSANRK